MTFFHFLVFGREFGLLEVFFFSQIVICGAHNAFWILYSAPVTMEREAA